LQGLRGRRLRRRHPGPQPADRLGRAPRQGGLRAERRRAGGQRGRVGRQGRARDGEVLKGGLLVPPAIAIVLFVAPAMVAAAPAAAAESAAPQDDDRPLDARTYAKGMDALKQGRRDEAIQTLKKVFQDFPDSPNAPQALLKVADLIYPAGDWTQIGSASPQAVKEAGDLLATLAQKYRSSREAPRALIKLGYIFLEPANPKADLEEACARFATAAQVYPDSDAADDAYFGSGMCETMRARPALRSSSSACARATPIRASRPGHSSGSRSSTG